MAKKPKKAENPQDPGEELVLTPGGWRPKSKVHFVPPDHHVSGKGDRLAIVHNETGKVLKDLGPIAPKGASAPAASRVVILVG